MELAISIIVKYKQNKHNIYLLSNVKLDVTSIDILSSKNQALCKYCTHVSNY